MKRRESTVIRRCLFVFAALIYMTVSPAAKVMYIANEGYLIQVGDKKILIDAMFNDETINYAHVPDSGTLASLEKAHPPFDKIDLVLVTHSHRDHFAAEPVLRHLANNPDAVLLAPPQAIALLREHEPELEKFGSRIKELNMELHHSTEMTLGGIRVEAHRLRHSAYMVKDEETGESRNRHEGVENLAYLVEIDGVRLFHIGDAVLSQNLEYFTDENFPSRKVKLAFLEFFDWSEETRELLAERIAAEHVVFMHLPREREQIDKYARHLQELFQNAVIFREPGEIREF
jgi:L-ascorbate metabolism protein UlaG (beta-lactamase superfamily)